MWRRQPLSASGSQDDCCIHHREHREQRGAADLDDGREAGPDVGRDHRVLEAAGAGLALLLGERLDPNERRAVGWTLLAVGIITTVPLIAQVFGTGHESSISGAP